MTVYKYIIVINIMVVAINKNITSNNNNNNNINNNDNKYHDLKGKKKFVYFDTDNTDNTNNTNNLNTIDKNLSDLIDDLNLIKTNDLFHDYDYVYGLHMGINIFDFAGPSNQFYYVLKALIYLFKINKHPKNINKNLLITLQNDPQALKLIKFYLSNNK